MFLFFVCFYGCSRCIITLQSESRVIGPVMDGENDQKSNKFTQKKSVATKSVQNGFYGDDLLVENKALLFDWENFKFFQSFLIKKCHNHWSHTLMRIMADWQVIEQFM